MKRPTELIEKAKGFKSTDPIRALAEYAVSLESPRKTVSDYEAEVERRKGEEWTHKSKYGKLCKVVYEDNETQLVYFSDGSRSCYWDAEHFAVKRKIISKAEAWDKAVSEDVSPFYILENYEVK